MKRIALWGYGAYGKRIYELLKRCASDVRISVIYDQSLSGSEVDDSVIADPAGIVQDYGKGLFNAVMITILAQEAYEEVQQKLNCDGIPLYTPLHEEDFFPAVSFTQTEGKISFEQEGYRLYAFSQLCGMHLSVNTGYLYLFDKQGRQLLEHWDSYMIRENRTHRMDLPLTPRSAQPEAISLSGEYCILAKVFSGNYSHFSFESMDCVQLLEENGFQGIYVLNSNPIIRELMTIYGIPAERIMTLADFEPGRVYSFEKTYLPKLMNNDRTFSAPVLKRMAAHIMTKLTRDSAYPSRLYVKRIGVRKLLNEEEFIRKYNLTVMVPEEHTLLEQMNCYYNADLILSPHGANNATSLYMREGTVLVETFGTNWIKFSYLPVLYEKGVYYLPVIAGVVKPDPDRPWTSRNADYRVPEIYVAQAMRTAEKLLQVPAGTGGWK